MLPGTAAEILDDEVRAVIRRTRELTDRREGADVQLVCR